MRAGRPERGQSRGASGGRGGRSRRYRLGLARAALALHRPGRGWGLLTEPAPQTWDAARGGETRRRSPCPRALPQTWANVALSPGGAVLASQRSEAQGALPPSPAGSREAPIPGRAGLRLTSWGRGNGEGKPVTDRSRPPLLPPLHTSHFKPRQNGAAGGLRPGRMRTRGRVGAEPRALGSPRFQSPITAPL